jgi:hypothetical protein
MDTLHKGDNDIIIIIIMNNNKNKGTNEHKLYIKAGIRTAQ